MDVKEGCHRPADMAEDPARDVGLALPKGLSHSHSSLSIPPFLFTLPKAGAVSSAPGRRLSCVLGDKGLPDRSGSKRQKPEDPLHPFSSFGRLRTFFRLELSALRGLRNSPQRPDGQTLGGKGWKR